MREKGKIRYAQLEKSPRLQRILSLLCCGKFPEYSTLDIIQGARVTAVSAAVAELRENLIEIDCRKGRANTYYYRLMDVTAAQNRLVSCRK